MKCPFMFDNADVIRKVVDQATPDERAAARDLARQSRDIHNPRERARFVVGWLRSLGEDPQAWGFNGRGPRVLELRR